VKLPFVIASIAALAATAAVAGPASATTISVSEYGTCVTHLIQLFGPQAVSQITTSIGPETVVVLPTGGQLLLLPAGRAAQGGLQACPVGS
jgi:hypothetical protein